MKKNMFKKIAVGSAVLAVASVSPAFAAVDTSAAVASITTDGGAAVSAVGGAIIGLAGVAVVFKWVKGAIFG